MSIGEAGVFPTTNLLLCSLIDWFSLDLAAVDGGKEEEEGPGRDEADEAAAKDWKEEGEETRRRREQEGGGGRGGTGTGRAGRRAFCMKIESNNTAKKQAVLNSEISSKPINH